MERNEWLRLLRADRGGFVSDREQSPKGKAGRSGERPLLTGAPRVQHHFANRRLVAGTGLEPASCEAADFKSAMFTNFISPAGAAIARGREFYHCAASAPNPGCQR